MTSRLDEIQAIALDVDGVLTDGSVLRGPNGEEWKRFHFADVMGLSLAQRAGVAIALISGEDSPLVDSYAKKLGIEHVWKGTRDKAGALREFAARADIPLSSICFMGDDINDLPAMFLAGVAACPANAATEVRTYVAANEGFSSTRTGGNGGVRDLIDALLAVRDLDALDLFLNVPREVH